MSYRIVYLITYRVYQESIIAKSLTRAFFAIVSREYWPGKKIFLCKALLKKRRTWGFEVTPKEFPQDIPPPPEVRKDFNKLKELIKKHAGFECIVEILRKLENFGFMSKELEELLNKWWQEEEFALLEGYRYKCAWLLKWLERNPINLKAHIRRVYTKEWKGIRKLVVEFKESVLNEPKILWLMRRLCFRNARIRLGYKVMYSPTTFEIVEDHLANHFPVIAILFPQVHQHLSYFPFAQEKIKLMWGSTTSWNLPKIDFESPKAPSLSLNINPLIHIIVEVDLARVAYFSIIGQAFQDWDESGYPRRVWYFSRDYPLSFLLRPGDIVVAQIVFAHGKNTFIIKPVQKISVDDALEIIAKYPNIRVICFDKPLDLYQELLNNITSIRRHEQIRQKLKERKPILDEHNFNKVVMKINELMSKYQIELEKRNLEFLLDAAKRARNLWEQPYVIDVLKAIFRYELEILKEIGFSEDESIKIISDVVISAGTREELKEKFWEIAKPSVMRYVVSERQREWNISLLNSIYPEIAKELVRKRLEDLKKSVILKRRVVATNEIYWDATFLKETYYGRKILSAFHIKDASKIDATTMKQIRNALEKIAEIREIDLTKFEVIALSHNEIRSALKSNNLENSLCNVIAQKIFSLARLSSTIYLRKIDTRGISRKFLNKLQLKLLHMQRNYASKIIEKIVSSYVNSKEKRHEIELILSEILAIRHPYEPTINIMPTIRNLFFTLKPQELLFMINELELPAADEWIKIEDAENILEKVTNIVSTKLVFIKWDDWIRLTPFYVIKEGKLYNIVHIKSVLGIPEIRRVKLRLNKEKLIELCKKYHLHIKIVDAKEIPDEIPEVILITRQAITISFPTLPFMNSTKEISGDLTEIIQQLKNKGIKTRKYFSIGAQYRGKAREYVFKIAEII